jgi:hypothetical protein
MRYAVIENNKVANIVIATPEVAAKRGWVECPEGVSIGWSFDGAGVPIEPAPDLEEIARIARVQRDNLLTESDVMVLPDRWAAMTTEQQSAWAAYRQALRDIPQQDDFPDTVVWPTQPE